MATVSAGRYYVGITGVGNAVTPCSDYGSLGQYFINGTFEGACKRMGMQFRVKRISG